MLGGATGYLTHHGREPYGPVFGGHHGMDAGGIRGPKAGAQVMGVLDPVQDEQKQRLIPTAEDGF
jgi:hypothetical protein